MSPLFLMMVLSIVALLAYGKQQQRCADQPPRFPGLSLSSKDSEEIIEVENAVNGGIKAIKKTDECFVSTYDVESQTLYLETKNGGNSGDYELLFQYQSSYSQSDQLFEENQHVSLWFEWERTESPSKPRLYQPASEILNIYVPGSITVFYLLTICLALIELTLIKYCCKSTRTTQVGVITNYPGDQHSRRTGNESSSQFVVKGNDKRKKQIENLVELSDTERKLHERRQKKKFKMSQFDSNVMVIDEKLVSFDDNQTRPAETTNSLMNGKDKKEKQVFVDKEDSDEFYQEKANDDNHLRKSQIRSKLEAQNRGPWSPKKPNSAIEMLQNPNKKSFKTLSIDFGDSNDSIEKQSRNHHNKNNYYHPQSELKNNVVLSQELVNPDSSSREHRTSNRRYNESAAQVMRQTVGYPQQKQKQQNQTSTIMTQLSDQTSTANFENTRDQHYNTSSNFRERNKRRRLIMSDNTGFKAKAFEHEGF